MKRGMGIADARAMHPTIEVVEADPDADRRLLESLADWCDRYTPLVALDGLDGLFLDITGCAHLFGGEKPMLEDMLSRFFHQGFGVRAGIASTAGAAWAAARFSGNHIVAPGKEEAFLGPLPLSALRIEQENRTRLESVGLRTAGAVMAAPRSPLVRRFGAALLLRLDQALGRLDEAISPRLPAAPLSVERQLAEPITQIEHVQLVTESLATTLKSQLEQRGEGARRLALILFRTDGAVSRIAVGTSRPLREPPVIQKLFHEKLSAIGQDFDVGFGFDLIRLAVLSTAPFEIRQADLVGEANDDDADIALFADRIRARLGEEAILKPVTVESHLPERAVLTVPFAREVKLENSAAKKPGKARDPVPLSVSRPEHPIRLFHSPEPIEVPATEVPEGPPLHFRWRRALHRVVRAEGPERIAAEWWRETIPKIKVKDGEDPEVVRNRVAAMEAARLTRDYFRVEDTEGRRYWLYRQGLYGMSDKAPRWFLHGLFA
ncbi:protein ImuB [Mesorhizobium sp. J18]|nr:protein ImuB [Mesorhizobium sp. J18]